MRHKRLRRVSVAVAGVTALVIVVAGQVQAAPGETVLAQVVETGSGGDRRV